MTPKTALHTTGGNNMCIIALKEKGNAKLDYATIKRMFEYNDDGAGFAIWKGGQKYVTIQKGYMTYPSFEKALKKAIGKTPVEQLALMLHFRITTHGGTSQQNCHPFVVDTVTEQKKIFHKTDLAVSMNGIADVKLPYNAKHSDTMEYIGTHMTIHKMLASDFYTRPDYIEELYFSTGAKWAFLDNNGKCYWTEGLHREENDGWIYSNDSYKTARVSSYSSWSEEDLEEWYNQAWKGYYGDSAPIKAYIPYDQVEEQMFGTKEYDSDIVFCGYILHLDGTFEQITTADLMYIDNLDRIYTWSGNTKVFTTYKDIFDQNGNATSYYDYLLV